MPPENIRKSLERSEMIINSNVVLPLLPYYSKQVVTWFIFCKTTVLSLFRETKQQSTYLIRYKISRIELFCKNRFKGLQSFTIFTKKLHHGCWTRSTVTRFVLRGHFLMAYFFSHKTHCAKSVRIRSFSGPYIYTRSRETANTDAFHTVAFCISRRDLHQIRVWVVLTGNSLFYLSFSLNLVNGKRIIKTWEGFCLREVFFSFIHFTNLQKKKKKKEDETNTSPCVYKTILFLSVICSFTILVTPSFSFSFLKTLSDALDLTMRANKATNFFWDCYTPQWS